MEYTEEIETWIACDVCGTWFHYACVGLISEPDSFSCDECIKF